VLRRWKRKFLSEIGERDARQRRFDRKKRVLKRQQDKNYTKKGIEKVYAII